jgi:hypothetical protein
LAAGTSNGPDHHEAWQTTSSAPRNPTVSDGHGHYVADPKDPAGKNGHGLEWNGNIPTNEAQGVHSMSDVFIYANGKFYIHK